MIVPDLPTLTELKAPPPPKLIRVQWLLAGKLSMNDKIVNVIKKKLFFRRDKSYLITHPSLRNVN